MKGHKSYSLKKDFTTFLYRDVDIYTCTLSRLPFYQQICQIST